MSMHHFATRRVFSSGPTNTTIHLLGHNATFGLSEFTAMSASTGAAAATALGATNGAAAAATTATPPRSWAELQQCHPLDPEVVLASMLDSPATRRQLIVSGVWLGNQVAAGGAVPLDLRTPEFMEATARALRRDNITHILSMADGLCCFPRRSDGSGVSDTGGIGCADGGEDPGFEYHLIRIADHEDAEVAPHLPGAIAFIDAALAGGGAVLVHCNAGVSRSASVVTAYLMHSRGWPFATAAALVRRKRPCVNLASFDRELVAMSDSIQAQHRREQRRQQGQSVCAAVAPAGLSVTRGAVSAETAAELERWLATDDSIPWEGAIEGRRVAQWGFRYDYAEQRVAVERPVAPIPACLRKWLLDPLIADGVGEGGCGTGRGDCGGGGGGGGADGFAQCIINSYRATDGIPFHVDDGAFGERILVFCLGKARPLHLRRFVVSPAPPQQQERDHHTQQIHMQQPNEDPDTGRGAGGVPAAGAGAVGTPVAVGATQGRWVTHDVVVGHGDCYEMRGETRWKWQHSVPVGSAPRVSVTFRTMADAAADGVRADN